MANFSLVRVAAGMLSSVFLWLASVQAVGAANVGLVYVEAHDPTHSLILESIVAGIKQPGRAQISIAAFGTGAAAPIDVNEWAKSKSLDAVIALGQLGAQVNVGNASLRIVHGGSDLSPYAIPEATGVSLAVDPELFFDYLQRLLPGVKRVFVVHEPKDRWLILLAFKSAKLRGLTLEASETKGDFAHGAQLYKDILQHMVPDHDALWLPINDKRLDRGNVLPWLIEESWVRRFAIFSNNFDDVRMGATFGLYPDPVAYGGRLLELAITPLAKGIEPARAIRSAVQLRFARHLGADLGTVRFDVTFPLR